MLNLSEHGKFHTFFDGSLEASSLLDYAGYLSSAREMICRDCCFGFWLLAFPHVLPFDIFIPPLFHTTFPIICYPSSRISFAFRSLLTR